MSRNFKLVIGEAANRTLRVGSRLDKFRLLDKLGQGGFATVWRAHDTIEDREVALKIPEGEFSDDAARREMIKEVRIMAGLDHPGVLRLKDAREIGEHFVLVFPLGEETLHDRIGRRMTRQSRVDYLRQMSAAVGYAHSQRVLHRDIKPENFIVMEGGRICLTDFGLARIGRGAHAVSASGTLGFIAPEQAMGRPTYQSDVFALGLVAYRMFSGTLPEYPFESPMPGMDKLTRDLSESLVRWITRAISLKPADRFADGVAMDAALRKIKEPLAASATRPGSKRRSTRRVA